MKKARRWAGRKEGEDDDIPGVFASERRSHNGERQAGQADLTS